jgi:large subunit ribosomal protein L20
MSGMNKKKLLSFAKGFRGRAKNCVSIARSRVMKALQYSYQGRKNKKRDFRKLWIIQINAGLRQHGLNYARFMHGCVISEVSLNRKMLSELAIYEPCSFKAVVNYVGDKLKAEEEAKKRAKEAQLQQLKQQRQQMRPTNETITQQIKRLKDARVYST